MYRWLNTNVLELCLFCIKPSLCNYLSMSPHVSLTSSLLCPLPAAPTTDEWRDSQAARPERQNSLPRTLSPNETHHSQAAEESICNTLNSLDPGRSSCDFENVIFNLALLIGIFKSSYDNVLRWMPQNLTDDKSTLVQVMAWRHQATSHYLNQCWLRFSTPHGITRPQWVNSLASERYGGNFKSLILELMFMSNLCKFIFSVPPFLVIRLT